MKNKILKLDNPCNEKWDNMKPNERGSYCDLCSKNVIDFTKLNQIEISEIMKKSGNKICARLTHCQLKSPLLNLENNFDLNFPKSKVAAGLILATSLTIGQTSHAENRNIKTEFIQSSGSIMNSIKEQSTSKPNEPKLDDLMIFKGKVTSEDLKKPVENAKITLVTSQKILSVYTSADGTFSFEIPTNLIDDDNVIRVSYYDVKEKRENEMFVGYETKDFILSKAELNTNFLIEAEPEVLYVGGIGAYSEKRKPIVLGNGVEIKYREFVKAQMGEKSSCSLENKDYLYFDSKFAIAIYGKKAKDGLYILTKKTEK
ncbi:carboxypeptidase-like regulatory domain-containing protein [Nonlabens xiamenensis]|uniref:carboxypeptidase-like regulatory domain-containing protein n=1 Tax=Nonlabens xiamenensis TaxID=2341043 RepID=UPI000F610017|nr:carboxypeptidase-like regulatory domain-containing protein [Nonlabens xiamenensis]